VSLLNNVVHSSECMHPTVYPATCPTLHIPKRLVVNRSATLNIDFRLYTSMFGPTLLQVRDESHTNVGQQGATDVCEIPFVLCCSSH
jgi:hypothetical protein